MTLAAYGALLDAVRGLSWPSRRRAAGVLPGSHESRRRGISPELSEYRAYRQGDDPRQLDWKLLARTDRAFVRLAEERAVMSTILVLDASASMAFPDGGRSKWECACALAVALAAIAHGSGDPVGLRVPTARGEVRLDPRSRRGTVNQIAAALGDVVPGGAPPLADVVAHRITAQRIVILSDFLGDEPALRGVAQALVASGRDVHAVHIVAADEIVLDPRAALVEDPEDPTARRSLTPASRAAYEQRFGAWREELARVWRLFGASFTAVVTNEDPARAVRRLVAG